MYINEKFNFSFSYSYTIQHLQKDNITLFSDFVETLEEENNKSIMNSTNNLFYSYTQ